MSKRSGYASNSSMFAKRGDPWVSVKEGLRDYGRNPETEDPEYDFDHRFHNQGFVGKPRLAEPHHELREPMPEKRTEPDFAQRKANVLRKGNAKMRATLCLGCTNTACAMNRKCMLND